MTIPADVTARLDFARMKVEGIRKLVRDGLFGHPPENRERLIHEFFSHLVAAINVLAQLVNERKELGIEQEHVSVQAVVRQLPAEDPLTPALNSLYVYTRGQPFPENPNDEDGLLFRIYNYRNQTEHRGRNYVDFSFSGPRLRLDPRQPGSGSSGLSVDDDLQRMLGLVESRCSAVLGLLDEDGGSNL